ncbi:hypothetical protein JOF56_007714 [Kibdelosporangium banguiense]|uniref:Uncharacterized protein n=1 Tax=Kibdelosporangium banguiense TaxID=1365924 RepID=A0ABS4TSD6_9PSEU|nr:hypothetical protein [Kibdelosporangium banguiense]MBP2327329.1 hypothetical protein [Kibdelosporangium banguiense]
MAIPVENDNSSRGYFEPENLAQWYDALVRYAAAAQPGNQYFHGPHVAAVKADLDRVRLGLTWLHDNHAEALARHPLPTLAELENPAGNGQVSIKDNGSPLHNFWHWING